MLRGEIYASVGDEVFFFKDTADRKVKVQSCKVVAELVYNKKWYKIFDFELEEGGLDIKDIITDSREYFLSKSSAEDAAVEYLRKHYLLS